MPVWRAAGPWEGRQAAGGGTRKRGQWDAWPFPSCGSGGGTAECPRALGCPREYGQQLISNSIVLDCSCVCALRSSV